jgi:hypothetical protein
MIQHFRTCFFLYLFWRRPKVQNDLFRYTIQMKYFLLISIFSLLVYQNCSEVRFQAVTENTEIGSTLSVTKTSLAIRGAACMGCHANIQSSFITDFGHGNNFFFGKDVPSPYKNHSTYGFWGNAWKYADIRDDVYIPEVNVEKSDLNPNFENYGSWPSTLPLSQIMGERVMNGSSVTDVVMNSHSMASGKLKVVKSLYIGAPTDAQLDAFKIHPKARLLRSSGSTSIYAVDGDSFTSSINENLKIQSNSRGKYVQNDGLLQCEGDIVIYGTLFLSNAELESTTRGCRLYVRGSVFIKGNIEHLTNSQNLQISSSRAVVMGIWYLEDRFFRSGLNMAYIREAQTLASLNAFKQRIIDERNVITNTSVGATLDGNILNDDAGPFQVLIKRPNSSLANAQIAAIRYTFDPDNHTNANPGSSNWIPVNGFTQAQVSALNCIQFRTGIDFANNPSGYNCEYWWAGDDRPLDVQPNLRKSIDYEKLLVNAPMVHSRYSGLFKGVIIAEVGLFAISHFSYQYDEVFSNKAILPLVVDDVLKVELAE